MDPITTRVALGAGVSKPVEPLTEPLIFIPSASNYNTAYIHALTTTGTKVGTFQCPTDIQGGRCFFRNPYLYVSPRYNHGNLYKVDCNDMSLVKTIALPYTSLNNFGVMGHMSPISPTKLISVSANTQSYYIFDTETDTFTSTSYPYPYTFIAQTHGTLTFFDQTSSGLTNFKDRVWWTGGTNTGYSIYLSYADLSAEVLGSSTDFNYPVNYSRNMGISMGSSKGLIHNFGVTRYRVTDSSTAPVSISYQSYTYGGVTYNPQNGESYNRKVFVASNATYLYQTYADTSPGAAGYNFRIAAGDPFASTSVTANDIGIALSRGYYYYSTQNGTVGYVINDAGYIAIAYYDVATYGATTDQVIIKIINGTNVVATYTTSVGSAFTAYNNGDVNSPEIFTDATWSTDLLYSGSTYS